MLIARPNNSNGGSIGKTLVGQLGKLALVHATQSAAGTGNRLAGR